MGTVPPTRRNGDFGKSPLLGSFSNETVFGSIDIGKLVKGFLPALGQLG